MQHVFVFTLARFVAASMFAVPELMDDHNAFLDVHQPSWNLFGRPSHLDQIMEQGIEDGYDHAAILDAHHPASNLFGRRPSTFDQMHFDQMLQDKLVQDDLRHKMFWRKKFFHDLRQLHRMKQQRSQMGAFAPLSYDYMHAHAWTKCGNSTQSVMCSSELSGGKRTDVKSENGKIYVNGHLVHEGLPADPASVRTINGAVYVNGTKVWPWQAAVEGPAAVTQDGIEKTQPQPQPVTKDGIEKTQPHHRPQPQPDQAVGAEEKLRDEIARSWLAGWQAGRQARPAFPASLPGPVWLSENANLSASHPPLAILSFITITSTSLILMCVMHRRTRPTDDHQPLLQK
eukprot:gnl/MRDRNA2_/MRDRNA2_83575_c0_seq1.p1 gnl/MRDRNA2_/MRDRNA2_83575_c0~~gnl/MRDRNA2_/MRDRNA2_83575_c0_seq1.p1  ORF type:complete len:343 (-),score=42.27 gnl/MRDRNA2_/MRDRNA2_83575_c0_seq1:463-1491(-)